MQAYLGEGLPGPLASLVDLKIPHPGRVAGQVVMKLTMPGVLGWVLGGNVGKIEKSRAAHCRLGDQPRAFSEAHFPAFMADDEAITHAIQADWMLLTERLAGSGASDASADATSTSQVKGIYITGQRAVVGRSSSPGGAHLAVDDMNVMPQHARVWRATTSSSSGDSEPVHEYYVQDMGSDTGASLLGSLCSVRA